MGILSAEHMTPRHGTTVRLPGRVSIGILATGSYLPETEIGNDEVAVPAGVDAAWISERTGILSRRRAAPDQATSDLAIAAARRALEAAAVRAADLQLIIVATSTPDYPQPSTASLVQGALGATGAAAFDINAVCSGFVFALSVAQRFLAQTAGGRALVIGADVYSRILNRTDRRTSTLFGDGAGAVILGDVPPERGMVADQLASFGEYADLIRVPGGGSRTPLTAEALAAGLQHFTMQGRAVREFVESYLPPAVAGFLKDAGLSPDDVDHVIPHQANGRMLDSLLPHLDLPRAVLHRTVERYGNTGAASIPITLDHANRSGRLRAGDVVLLAGFGGGMATGISVLHW
ncbi:3-oxoacyl-[acyl-carrier-protein] synthase-3 [Actinoplanes campanulatus]|uniref:3-oxoacyl-[acyl-carrier-protein] synthase-3 n=1 Tax=Actinoplanes campanulatus TaxID=113559 RepID=A0A7W5AII6_9ACTN|nr:ketoacyl-ACP synthase III [Actinoplanes campanulatus]MBB3096917.1 3-oxoacyl-[acyl-carrier-protein] synthase-3 [Actinoplanes campanulatus]GGN44874.1 3-oxoacyl-[acyl-carrier-protein] synthase 3 [Actinoplanes campanulatus]GID37460.1 3-oxoacyl-[acyl-carrier-protein] synthase 3 [Actinoplanes campanulatus]